MRPLGKLGSDEVLKFQFSFGLVLFCFPLAVVLETFHKVPVHLRPVVVCLL